MLVIRGLNGDQKEAIYRVHRPIIVGRSRNCDVFIADVRSSRQQARFFRNESGELVVEDLNSLNGTYLNGRQIAQHPLRAGDVVRLGSTDFRVEELSDDNAVELVDIEGTDGGEAPALSSDGRFAQGYGHSNQEIQIIKQADTVELPSLGALPADDYFKAIGIDESVTGEEGLSALQRKTRNFATLFEISSMQSWSVDESEMLQQVLDILLKVPGGDFAYVALLADGILVPKVVRSKTGHRERITLSKTIGRYVLQERCAVLAPDLRNDNRFSGSDSIIMGPSASILAAPMIQTDTDGERKVIGLLALCTSSVRENTSEDDLDLLCVVAGMLSTALAKIALQKQRERTLSELEQANRKILETQEQLIRSERLAAIGRLSSGVIHEVKNHLSPLMLADMIAEQYPEDEDIQEMAEMVIEARRRILDIVDEIRMFARGDNRSYSMQPHRVGEVCSKVIRFVRCDAKVRAVRLSFDQQDDAMVIIDSDRIRQVLINLIQNAADAVENIESPEVSVRVCSAAVLIHQEIPGWESASASTPLNTSGDELDSGCIYICVRDNGTGIEPNILRQIFDPLFTTKGENGLGLGLDICRRIVRAHRGTLSCVSRVGVGTEFRVGIPLTFTETSESLEQIVTIQ